MVLLLLLALIWLRASSDLLFWAPLYVPLGVEGRRCSRGHTELFTWISVVMWVFFQIGPKNILAVYSVQYLVPGKI